MNSKRALAIFIGSCLLTTILTLHMVIGVHPTKMVIAHILTFVAIVLIIYGSIDYFVQHKTPAKKIKWVITEPTPEQIEKAWDKYEDITTPDVEAYRWYKAWTKVFEEEN